jgi:hypothetical protein
MVVNVEVRFYKDGDNWEVDCDEAGLVGYADPDINVVREKVFDSIKFFLENDDIEFLERIISIEELG